MKYWLRGLPVPGLLVSGKNVGQMNYWVRGLPVAGGQLTSPYPPPAILATIQSDTGVDHKRRRHQADMDFVLLLPVGPVSSTVLPFIYVQT